jgi:butyryl-CoA dehydrogenase
VPKENLVWDEGRGFNFAMDTLNGGRIGIAAQAIGIAEASLNAAIKYSKERKAFVPPFPIFRRSNLRLQTWL